MTRWSPLLAATAVNGTFTFCGLVGGCGPSYRVTGTIQYPHVSLQWTEVNGGQRQPQSFDGTLSTDGDTLVSTDSTERYLRVTHG